MTDSREEYLQKRFLADWEYRLSLFDQYDIADKDEFNVRQLAEMSGCSVPTIYKVIGTGGKPRYSGKEFVAMVNKYIELKTRENVERRTLSLQVEKMPIANFVEKAAKRKDDIALEYLANKEKPSATLINCPVCGEQFRKYLKLNCTCSKTCKDKFYRHIIKVSRY